MGGARPQRQEGREGHLYLVCPFAKEHLARHLELKERYAVAAQASIAENESWSGGQTDEETRRITRGQLDSFF